MALSDRDRVGAAQGDCSRSSGEHPPKRANHALLRHKNLWKTARGRTLSDGERSKTMDNLHPNDVIRQVASDKPGKFLSKLGQDLKVPFDVANWVSGFLTIGSLSATPRQIFRSPIPLSRAAPNPLQRAAKQRARTLGDHLTSPTPSTWRPSDRASGEPKVCSAT